MSDSSSEKRLIFDLVQHEDAMFYQRANFFLVAESLILVAYSFLFSRKAGVPVQGRVIAGFGFILSATWVYAAHRSLVRFKYVTRRAEAEYSYYRLIRDERPKAPRFMGSTHLMAYMIPSVATLMWIVLLFT